MRRLPTAFLLAIIFQALTTGLRFALLLNSKASLMASGSWSLFAQGMGFATLALLAAGSFDLARTTTGQRSQAARIAGIVFAVGLGLTVVGVIVDFVQIQRVSDSSTSKLLYDIEAYAWSIVMIGGIAALITAADGWRKSAPFAAVAVVAVVIARGPPFLNGPLYEALQSALGRTGASMVFSLCWLVTLGCIVLLLTLAHDRAEPAEDLGEGERGLRRAARALWLRVIAAAVFAAMSMMAIAAGRGGALTMLQFALVAGPVINAFALGSFGFGAFTTARSGVRDFSSVTLYLAGALSLWAAGAMMVQLPWLYELVFKSGEGYGGDHGRDLLGTFALVIPLVASAGVVVLSTAIAGFARKRNLEDLRAQVVSRTFAFVGLILLSLLVQQYGLPKAKSQGSFLGMTLLAAGAGLYAIAMVAKLCALAADALRREPGLPTATLRPPD